MSGALQYLLGLQIVGGGLLVAIVGVVVAMASIL